MKSRVRVKTFNQGFSVTFERLGRATVDAMKEITGMPCVAGWRVSSCGPTLPALYLEPPEWPVPARGVGLAVKRQVKADLRAKGWDVVAESKPLAGQVR